jgi:hypothetical protein
MLEIVAGGCVVVPHVAAVAFGPFHGQRDGIVTVIDCCRLHQ